MLSSHGSQPLDLGRAPVIGGVRDFTLAFICRSSRAVRPIHHVDAKEQIAWYKSGAREEVKVLEL